MNVTTASKLRQIAIAVVETGEHLGNVGKMTAKSATSKAKLSGLFMHNAHSALSAAGRDARAAIRLLGEVKLDGTAAAKGRIASLAEQLNALI